LYTCRQYLKFAAAISGYNKYNTNSTKTNIFAYMLKSNKLQAGLLLASVLGLAGAIVPVSAQNSSTTVASLTINAGALTITAPATVTLSALTVSATNQTSTGSTSNVFVQDLRGSNVGWSATATMTNFGGGVSNPNDVIPIFCETTSYFSLTPDALTVAPGDPGSLTGLTDYTTAQATTEVSDLTEAGVSNTFNIASFSTGNGTGRFQKVYGLSQEVVSYGNYTTACPGLANDIISAGTYTADLVSSVA
jgi:hypothetical protein